MRSLELAHPVWRAGASGVRTEHTDFNADRRNQHRCQGETVVAFKTIADDLSRLKAMQEGSGLPQMINYLRPSNGDEGPIAKTMFSDDDRASLDHAVTMYNTLPNAELPVVPGISHLLLQEKPTLCNTITVDLLTIEPVPTVAPIRLAENRPTA